MVEPNAIDAGAPAPDPEVGGGMDPLDALADKVASRIATSSAFVDKIAQKLDEMFGGGGDGAVEEDYNAGLGDAYVPEPIGAGGPAPAPAAPAAPAHPEPDGDEGEAVTDDLDDEDPEEDDEDMDEPAQKGSEKYNSHCAPETPPKDAKRSREQYAATLAPEIKRLRAEFEAERARYQKHSDALQKQVEALVKDRERTHRTRVLEGLLVDGYELNVEEELGRLERYGRDTFDNEVNIIRHRYKRSEPMSEYLPVSAGGYVPAGAAPEPDYNDPDARQAMLDGLRAEIRQFDSDEVGSSKPDAIGASFVRYRKSKSGGNGTAVRG